MKSFIVIFACLLTFFTFSCTPVSSPPSATVTIDVEAETATIKKIVLDQTKAFIAQDVDKMVAYHTDPAQVIQNVYGQTDIMSETLPHDVMKGMLREYFEATQGRVRTDEKTSDWNIRISDDGSMAWVTYKSEVVNNSASFTNEEIRVLEKVDGTWKLALVSTLIGLNEDDIQE